jgi:excisionase family DNA binding protein/diguanylate cyclase (GGDEF)-like protein
VRLDNRRGFVEGAYASSDARGVVKADHLSLPTALGSWSPPEAEPERRPSLARESLAALVVGIDRLRDVADALGPQAAEAVLATTAARLEARRPPGTMLAQLFGDAFALLAPQLGRVAALDLARELYEVASQPIAIADHELSVSVSVGVAFEAAGGIAAQGALRDAAAAQHRAQQRGGGRVELFEPETGESALESLRLEGELRRALASPDGGLTLFFQPVVALDTGIVTAVEALVRWIHPSLGLLLPQRFLPLAERTGLIAPLERWVIGEACRRLASLPEPQRVLVNLSTNALNDTRLVSDIAEHLRAHDLRPDQLAVELSESTLLPAHSAARVTELRSLGVAVLLDDVGSGYAWLTRSERLAVDGLKLSSSIVAKLAVPEVMGLARLIVDAAAKLAIPVTAEGVETAAQLELVRSLGISSAQGLHFLAPVPAATLADVLALSGAVSAARAAVPAVLAAHTPAAGEERAVSLGQAAKLLGISASTLRRWAEDGRVSSVRTSGGHRRFYLSDLSRLNQTSEARLRRPSLPDGPVPGLAALLAADGLEIATAAARSLYDERPGWFARAAALDPLRAFTTELAQAFEHGRYERLGDALRRLMLAATVGSATLAERHLFLERFAAALDSRLIKASRPAREQTAARRTLSALSLTQLADCDAPASAPRVPARRRRAGRLRDGHRETAPS